MPGNPPAPPPFLTSIRLPAHRMEIDETRFLRLLAGAVSLMKDEKRRIIEAFPRLSQQQADELIEILAGRGAGGVRPLRRTLATAVGTGSETADGGMAGAGAGTEPLKRRRLAAVSQRPNGLCVLPALVLLLALSRPVPAQWERILPGSGALELFEEPSARHAELLSADRCREVAADLDFFAWRNARLVSEGSLSSNKWVALPLR